MASISIKQKVLAVVQQLPPDATVEDAIERLHFLAKVERGVAQANAGETLPHEAARKQVTHIVWTLQAIEDVEAIRTYIAGTHITTPR